YKINNYFNLPYKSLNQAKHFNNGVVPPDLSLITKYKSIEWIYEVLTGYIRNHLQSHNNFFYNKRFKFGITAMRPPLTNGCIKHNFNVPLTVHQYSRDISEFLHWVSEPWINSRKKLILPVLSFFIFMHTLLLTNLNKYL
ncbi:cytochrome c1, partial [Candidatus Hodgkinia cicadicola]